MVDKTEIKITGVAQNGLGGALVLTAARKIYYIDGLESWDTTVVGKQVEVSGRVRSENFSADDLKNDKGEWKEGIEGEKVIIVSAEWKLH